MNSETVIDKFLRYVSFDTQSSEESSDFPSTPEQAVLAAQLVSELKDMGLEADYDPQSGCVYSHIEANCQGRPALGFISHLDTSPETSGKNVRPRFVRDYDGGDITLNEEQGIILSPSVFPELRRYVGKTLIVTDGTTLLGADDKAGIAEIMAMARELVQHPEISHGRICIAFTPDEEIGGGIGRFDLERFGADYAYTVDGGALGELEYECFNAASAQVVIHGVNVHTGEAKGKMKNASRIALEFDAMLPPHERPELTEGYEGFFHLEAITGSVERAELEYLIRDHDRERFDEKKRLMEQAAAALNGRYGAGTVELELSDTYRNMKEKIYPENMFLIDGAAAAMRELGIEPMIQPIRGGTDGANLSWRGLPCPNLCAGGHNFHGRYEYICAESMEAIVKLLIRIAESIGEDC
ncbi:MAG: peptidase T [Ruminococcus sp.]|nr:peptidase T [Ruminococcus sp.]